MGIPVLIIHLSRKSPKAPYKSHDCDKEAPVLAPQLTTTASTNMIAEYLRTTLASLAPADAIMDKHT